MTHVHDWAEVNENMVEGVWGLALGDIIARCSNGDCNAELREPEILRRLNATEGLNADQAKFMAVDGNGKLLKSDVYKLLKYAAALEESPTT